MKKFREAQLDEPPAEPPKQIAEGTAAKTETIVEAEEVSSKQASG
jgi:hypothetical protein